MTAVTDAVPEATRQDAKRTAVPLYFGPEGAELFGWFHRPDGVGARPGRSSSVRRWATP